MLTLWRRRVFWFGIGLEMSWIRAGEKARSRFRSVALRVCLGTSAHLASVADVGFA